MATEGKGDASFGHHFNEILKHQVNKIIQGIKGFYRGISTNVTRACVLNATKMGIYDELKEIFKKAGFKDSLFVQFCCAFTAGFFMSCTVTPFDMVRTRVMNQPKETLLYKGMMDCFS